MQTWFELENGVLYQYVDHLAGAYEYPIVADPVWFVPLIVAGGRVVLTTRNPSMCDAHHTLPQAFRTNFVNVGFTGNDSIDHPRYLVWWNRSDHRTKSAAVNNEWRAWFSSTTIKRTKVSALTKRTAVLRKYPAWC